MSVKIIINGRTYSVSDESAIKIREIAKTEDINYYANVLKELADKKYKVITGHKVNVLDHNTLTIGLPNANTKWTFAVWNAVQEFINTYCPYAYVIHEHDAATVNNVVITNINI